MNSWLNLAARPIGSAVIAESYLFISWKERMFLWYNRLSLQSRVKIFARQFAAENSLYTSEKSLKFERPVTLFSQWNFTPRDSQYKTHSCSTYPHCLHLRFHHDNISQRLLVTHSSRIKFFRIVTLSTSNKRDKLQRKRTLLNTREIELNR